MNKFDRINFIPIICQAVVFFLLQKSALFGRMHAAHVSSSSSPAHTHHSLFELVHPFPSSKGVNPMEDYQVNQGRSADLSFRMDSRNDPRLSALLCHHSFFIHSGTLVMPWKAGVDVTDSWLLAAVVSRDNTESIAAAALTANAMKTRRQEGSIVHDNQKKWKEKPPLLLLPLPSTKAPHLPFSPWAWTTLSTPSSLSSSLDVATIH